MGFYRGPNIVTDGLELVVDIASERLTVKAIASVSNRFIRYPIFI